MKNIFCTIFSLFFLNLLFAQQHTDFIGAGHDAGITVTTSHNQNSANNGTKSIDGFPVTDSELLGDASRFLAQATLGYDYETIQMVAAMGHEAWLDEQFRLPRRPLAQHMLDVANLEPEYDEEGNLIYALPHYRTGWWQYAMRDADLLRQKTSYALSQIFVVSSFGNDFFEDHGLLSGSYYDVLTKNAFGNYRTLLSEVSQHSAMGLYLSHLNNPKSDPANNIHPDENYAREVMQLFSIGLYELNLNGTRQVDGNGNFIATYNNNDIREFAKIFTGFGDGHPEGEWGDFPANDEANIFATTPMKMYEEWHEPGQKNLLNGQVVPAGQTGLQDFNDAMDNLHNHPNVGPFIGKALIQFLVSSNPSADYVERVATVFNDNGAGVKGDMEAVLKAILLDPEARDCDAVNNPEIGKLREPVTRYTHFMQAFHAVPSYAVFETTMDRFHNATGQIPLYSPSVFNFYLPEFQPNGLIANADLFAPVFQIHNSSTSIGFINETNAWTFNDLPMIYELDVDDPEDIVSIANLDFSAELALANDPAALVNRLNILLAAGQLSESTKTIITNAVTQLNTPEEKVDMAVYLIMIAPDFAILK